MKRRTTTIALPYKETILRVLNEASMPLDVENIRARANIKNWQTAHKHLLELLVDKKISGQKTSHGWIFWARTEERPSKSA
jgi:hypothetical protein